MPSPTPPAGPFVAPAGLGVLGVDHVGLAVPDLEQALAFHTGVLGLVLRHREENAELEVAEAMLGPDDSDRGAEVQLVAPLGAGSPIARFLDRRGPGLQHLALGVADVAAAGAVARAQGLEVLYDPARVGTRGSLVTFLHPRGTGGVLVELVQRAPHGVADAAGAAL